MYMAGMAMGPEWDIALLEWPALWAQTLIFGSAILYLTVRMTIAGDTASSDTMARTLIGWWRILAGTSAVFSCLLFVRQVAGMADVSWRGALPLLGEVLRQTRAGNAWEWRLPASAALLIVAFIPLRETLLAGFMVLLCLTIFLSESLMSHAVDFGAASIASVFLHLVTVGLWGGALFGYWISAGASAKPQLQVAAARALSRLAAWSVPLLILSGTYLAYEGLGHSLDHLLHSSYGLVLLFKLEVFAAVLALGAYNRFYLMSGIEETATRRNFLRNVAAESILIAGVIGLATLLASTSPARLSFSTTGAAVARVRDQRIEPQIPKTSKRIAARRSFSVTDARVAWGSGQRTRLTNPRHLAEKP
jgi:putative copper export protein